MASKITMDFDNIKKYLDLSENVTGNVVKAEMKLCDELIAAAKASGIKVLVDMVPEVQAAADRMKKVNNEFAGSVRDGAIALKKVQQAFEG